MMKAMFKTNHGADSSSKLSGINNIRLGARQSGGIYSTLLIATMFGMFLLTALKLTPSYIENMTIVNTMEGIDESQDLSELSIAEIRSSLSRTLITNGIRDFSTKDVQEVRVGDRYYVDIVYEKRIPIVSNIEAVLTFNERFEK